MNAVVRIWLVLLLLGGNAAGDTAPGALSPRQEQLTFRVPAGFRVEGVGLYEQPACPGCGLHNVRMLGHSADESAVWKCRACGQEWQSRGEL